MDRSSDTTWLYQEPSRRRVETPLDTQSVEAKLRVWHPQKELIANKLHMIASALERVAKPEQYLTDLMKIIDSEIRWVKDPQEKLVELSNLVREPETAAEVRAAAEHWNQRFPVGEVPDEEMPHIKYRDGKSFFDVMYAFTKDQSGYTTRPLDLMYDVQDSFLILEELYQIERQHPEHGVAYHWSTTAVSIQRRGHLPKLLEVYRDCADQPTNVVHAFIQAFEQYERHHPVSTSSANAFKQRLLPAIERVDEDAKILATGGNIFGMMKGREGAGDFITRCYVAPVDQPTLLELCLDAETIPALDFSVRIQNVQDGLGLICFGILRDQIHDQMPGTHAIVSAMIAYYEDPVHDTEPLKQICRTSRSYFSEGYRPDAVEGLLNLETYEQLTTVRSPDGIEYQERVMDVLQRVAKNTTRPLEQLKACPFPGQADHQETIQRAIQEGRRIPSQETLTLIRTLNADLKQRLDTKTPSLTPSYVRFIVWADQLAFRVLQDYRFEEQLGAYKTPLFKELLRFHELRYADPYDEAVFEAWYDKLLAPEKGSVTAIYQTISQRVLSQLIKASRLLQFSQRDHQQDLLWSGNLTDQLIGFVDLREANTPIGKRKRSELLGGPYTE